MNKLRIYITACFLLLSCFAGYTVNAAGATYELGFPFIKNFQPKDYRAHSQNFCIIQDKRGVMYFGNFAGILEFDGETWRIISTENGTRVLSMSMDASGRIYVGAYREFGYLMPDSVGSMKYVSLMDNIKEEDRYFDEVIHTYAAKEGIYFITNNRIFLKKGSEFEAFEPPSSIISAYHINNVLYLLIKDSGLMYFEDNTFKRVPDGDRFSKILDVNLMLPYKGRILIGSGSQGLFTLSDMGINPYHTEADDYFKANVITSGAILSDSSLIIGTTRGGIINLYPDGKIKQILSKKSGLYNEYIINFFVSDKNSLWVALNNGIAKVEIPSPISYFDTKSGLIGGVIDMLRISNTLYFATYQGLFYLDNSNGMFERIPGITTAAWSLLDYQGRLLVATSKGVYQIKDNLPIEICKGFSFKLFSRPGETNKIYVGQKEGLRILGGNSGNWNDLGLLPELSDEIRDVKYDNNGNLWLGTSSKGIIRYNPESYPKIKYFGIEEGLPSLIGNYINIIGGEFFISSKNGVYTFNQKEDKFFRRDIIEIDTSDSELWLKDIVQDKAGNLWITKGNEKNISYFTKNASGKYDQHQIPFLPIADFVCWKIFPDDEGIVWLGGPEGLVKYNPGIDKNYEQGFNSLIRSVYVQNDSLVFEGAFIDKNNIVSAEQNEFLVPELSYENNSIRFEFAATDYNIKGELKYQFILEGFNKTWSEWTNESKKEYTNLPDGKYTFKVRAENVFGFNSKEAVFEFVVLTPWYKTYWAMAIYVVIGAVLIVLIVRIRSRKLIKEKQVLENLIEERTTEIVKQKEELEKQSETLAIKNNELERISMIVKEINSELNIRNLLQSILDRTKSIKGVEKSTALVLDKSRNAFVYKASSGWDVSQYENIFLSINEAENRYLSNTEEIYEDVFFSNDFEAGYSNEFFSKLPSAKSIIVIVVKVEDKVEGFLLLENMRNTNVFTQDAYAFIKNLKEHIISAFIKTKILEDLQDTFDNLKDTQNQLIQSEKLASLGQLTAGIAHEIQNPLNFVNNFSSLSVDLVEDLNEVLEENKSNLSGDTIDEVEDILNMMKSNVTKINEHGKRAEGIVKGMLMHSRGVSGAFVDTDMNAMVEEYAKLAYHGVRAENKDFNTEIVYDLADNTGRAKVVPQDFSRVILNIMNNACYAVNEKFLKLGESFSPLIKVSTKKEGGNVIIKIRDNGLGIPKEIIEKIFNPFFTTKPTGKGTGLGLSMSYDIVTQIHKGKLKVQSEEGNFTEFTIILPEKAG